MRPSRQLNIEIIASIPCPAFGLAGAVFPGNRDLHGIASRWQGRGAEPDSAVRDGAVEVDARPVDAGSSLIQNLYVAVSAISVRISEQDNPFPRERDPDGLPRHIGAEGKGMLRLRYRFLQGIRERADADWGISAGMVPGYPGESGT